MLPASIDLDVIRDQTVPTKARFFCHGAATANPLQDYRADPKNNSPEEPQASVRPYPSRDFEMIIDNRRYLVIFLSCIFAMCWPVFAGCKKTQPIKPNSGTETTSKAKHPAKKSGEVPELKVIDANPYYFEILGWMKIPFVVQNAGKNDAYDVKVVAVAYDRKGEFLAKTSSDDKYRLAPPEKINPSKIAPGGKGYGILCLGNLREYGGIRFRVSAADEPKSSQRRQLEIVEHAIAEERLESAKGAAVKKTISGTVRNSSNEEVSDVFVSVAGFDKDGKIVDFVKVRPELKEIPPGSTSSFSADFETNRPIDSYEIVAAEEVVDGQ